MQLSADSRKKKRRRRRKLAPALAAACSSRSAAGAAKGQCHYQCCCCSSPGGGGGGVATTPCAFSHCSDGASSSPAAGAVRRLGAQQHSLTVLLLALALLLVLPPSTPHLVAGASVSPRRMARIQRHLDRINKTPVRSIRCADGDTIDCVPAHEQHGLEHPLLRAHTVQTEPPEAPMPRARGGGGGGSVYPAAAGGGGATSTATNGSSSGGGGRNNGRYGAWQTWHHGGHCPRGTVAVRRTTSEDVLRARSISRFGRKRRHRDAAFAAARAANAPDVITGNGHEAREGRHHAPGSHDDWSEALPE